MSSTRSITLSLSVRDAATVKQQLEQLGPAGENALKRLEQAAQRAAGRGGIGQLGDVATTQTQRMGGAFTALSSQAGQLIALLGVGGGLAGSLTALVRSGDALTGSLNRLQNATGSVQGAAAVYGALYRSALQTGVSVTESVDAFQRFSIAARAIGATREEVTQLVTGLQRVAIVSGASAGEVGSASLQLAQALASGTLQGDELRSVLEALPLLAEALARELGVSIGQLRQMGSEGQLTADRVFPALLRATERIGQEFERAPLTVERAFGSLSAATDRFLGQLDQAIGLSGSLARSLAGAASALDGARQGLGLLSDAERLVQMRGQADALAAQIGRAEAEGTGPSLRAPANRNSIRAGAVGAARTQAGATAAGDLEDMRRQYFALLAEIETAERALIASGIQEREQAARQATEDRRQRATQQVTELRRDLDAEFKAREEHARRVRQLDEALQTGAISPEERQRLGGLADADRDAALRRAAGSAGGGGRRRQSEAERELNEALRERDSLLRSLETPYDTYVRRLEELAQLQERLPEGEQLSNDQLQRAADRLAADLQQAESGATQLNDIGRQVGLTFSSAFEDAIIRGQDFRTVVEGLISDLARLAIRKAVVEPLANAAGSLIGSFFGPAGSAVGGAVGSAAAGGLKFANGGVFFAGQVVPFADGGMVNSPTFFPMAGGRTGLMGEAGPEAIMPLGRDSSGRLGVRAQGGGGGIVQNITIDARGADAGVDQKIRVAIGLAVQEAKRSMTSDVNRGGTAAKTFGRRG